MMDTVNEQNPASCISYVVNYNKSDVSFLRLQEPSLKVMSLKKVGEFSSQSDAGKSLLHSMQELLRSRTSSFCSTCIAVPRLS